MRRFFGVVIGLTALVFAGAAPANTIDVFTNIAGGDRKVVSEDEIQGFYDTRYSQQLQAELAYDGTGQGGGLLWTFSDDDDDVHSFGLDVVLSTAWLITPSNPKTEVAFLDKMVEELNLGPAPSEIFYDKIDGAGTEFTTSREYFWIKQGDWTAYFRNKNPGRPITVVVEDGYSHYGVAGVPIPPAFLLFGSALLGMGWLARRQRARKDREAEALAV